VKSSNKNIEKSEEKFENRKATSDSDKEPEKVNNAILQGAKKLTNETENNDVIVDNLYTNFSHSTKNLNKLDVNYYSFNKKFKF